MTSHVMPTYARQPITFERGEGAWLFDREGKRYLDAVSGVAVCSLGHAHPKISEAICNQAKKLLHSSNLYRVELQEKLALRLCELSSMDNAFFCNSGAEANEAAIKLARKFAHSKGIEKPSIIVMQSSFHGRTLATLSATGNSKVQEGFEPLVEGFIRVPYDDIEAVKAQTDGSIVAILVEPVQGEGGVQVPGQGYLKALREICDARGWLLMLDEIQTGIGRSGTLFAFQQENILPDVCTLAKALGNGVPIGACLAKGQAALILTAGKHGSTFGGNPLACAAALAVLEIVVTQNLAERAKALGDLIASSLQSVLSDTPGIVEIRHKGLLIGIELERPCADLVPLAMEAGLLINVTADKTIRLLPPLIFTDEEAHLLVEKLSGLIFSFLKEI